jgi:predicted MFS family arabinose efflux permease
VPLGDLLENRKLMITTTGVAILSLLSAAFAQTPNLFLLASLLVGFSSVAVQILIPLAAHLAPEETRGRVVGSIMGGLLLGILLARPASSLIADHFGWRAVFGTAAVVMLVISLVLATTIPKHQPAHNASYGQLLKSLWTLLRKQPVLRQRAFYQACMFATFSLFWTAVPLELAGHYGLSQSQIAIFALVGAIGAIAAPIAGRLADAGHTRVASLCAMLFAALSFLPSLITPTYAVIGMAVTGIVLDFLRADEHGSRPALGLRPGCEEPQPPQRPVHDQHLYRRRHWFGDRQRPVRPRRLDLDRHRRERFSAARAAGVSQELSNQMTDEPGAAASSAWISL